MVRKASPAKKPPPAEAPSPGRESLLTFADDLTRLGRAEERAEVVPERHLVTFALDREEFGIPIERVREIIRVADITRVPQSPPHIRGVTNLRGRILPVVEIRTRFGLAPLITTPRARIVLVEAHGRILGLLVDAVSQVVKVPETAIAPPPDEVRSVQADYLTGVARLGQRLIVLLDLDRALLLSET